MDSLPTIPETRPVVLPAVSQLGKELKTGGKRRKPLAKRARDRVLVVLSLLIVFRTLSREAIPAGREVNSKVHNSYRITKFLVDSGLYNVSKPDKTGRSLLHQSARAGNEKLCKFLLSRDANASARDELGRTPLHEAAAAFSGPCIRSLIDSGASPAARTESGVTPIHRAVASLWVTPKEDALLPTLRLLVEKGADPKALDAAGRSPFAYLFDRPPGMTFTEAELRWKGGAAEEAVWAFQGWGVNVSAPLSQAGHTALHLAAGWAPGSLVWGLIDAGVSPSAPLTGKKGWGAGGLRGATPLHFAAQNGNLAMASALLGAGALVDAADVEGMTPLHYAAEAMGLGGRGPAPLARDAERNERLLGMLELLCASGAIPVRRTSVRAPLLWSTGVVVVAALRGAFALRCLPFTEPEHAALQNGLVASQFLTLLRPLEATAVGAELAPPPGPEKEKGAGDLLKAVLGTGKRRRLPMKVVKEAKRILDKAAEEQRARAGAGAAAGGAAAAGATAHAAAAGGAEAGPGGASSQQGDGSSKEDL